MYKNATFFLFRMCLSNAFKLELMSDCGLFQRSNVSHLQIDLSINFGFGGKITFFLVTSIRKSNPYYAK